MARPAPGDVGILRYLGWAPLSHAHARWVALRRSPTWAFAARFAVWFLALEFLDLFLGLSDALAGPTTFAVVGSSNRFGLLAVQDGTVVTFANAFSYVIEGGCTGLAVATMLVAAIAAYPAPWRARAAGIALGVPFVLLVNVGRLDTMGWLGVRSAAWFAFAHEFAWQLVVIMITGFGYLGWVHVATSEGRGALERTMLWEVASSIPLFVASFALVAWLAYLVDAASLLNRMAIGASLPLGAIVWGSGAPPPRLEALAFKDMVCVVLLGAACLFATTPGASFRERARGVAWGAVVPIFAMDVLHVLLLGWTLSRHQEVTSLEGAVLTFLIVCFPVILWLAWVLRRRRTRLAAAGGRPAPLRDGARRASRDRSR